MEYVIRLFEEQDADRLGRWWLELIEDHWNQTPMGWHREEEKPKTKPQYTRESLRAKIRNENTIAIYIAEAGEDICGTATLSWKDKVEGVVVCTDLCVHPKFHRMGMGKALSIKRIEKSIELKARRMEITTWAFNRRAIRLDKKLGFFWIPGTSVSLENYIPLIFQYDEAKSFFHLHHWYTILKRDIVLRPDVYERDGKPVFPYMWQEGDDRLECIIDWQEKKILSLRST